MARGKCAACQKPVESMLGPFMSGSQQIGRASLISTLRTGHLLGYVIEQAVDDRDKAKLITSETLVCDECMQVLINRALGGTAA